VDLIELTATELVEKLNRREVRAVDVTVSFLKAIRERDKNLRAFLHVDESAAMKQAEAIDATRERGEPIGKLTGVPVAVKDIFCTAGVRTTCGSKILENFVPPYDAHVIARLRAEDGVVIGKTNMDEFAMGSSTENSGYQVTGNPWDPSRVPGGSSGGSAAAVAACMAPLALGTDTGGSIRQPAALCGIVGMKPTYGRVSRFGVVAFASSLDQVGPLGHNVRDAALLLEVVAGHDRRDSTSVDRPVPLYSRTIDEPIRPLTIGVAREHFALGLDAEVERAVREAIKVYKDQGAKVVDISLPASPYSVAVYYLVATAEASSNLARYDGVHYGHRSRVHKDLIEMYSRSRGEGFGAEVKRRIMLGTYALSSGYKDAYYVKALKVRRLIKEDFDRAFEKCDVVMGPTSPTAAFKAGEKVDDPLAMYLNDIYTIAAPLAGIAGISIPCGFNKAGLPIGLHLTGAPFEEEKLLRVARMYERATDWHTRRPRLSA
jgi:aspartyl-tRNA(Asn)/glutamyl-tRNA(Gln) amidotransferase subunit A